MFKFSQTGGPINAQKERLKQLAKEQKLKKDVQTYLNLKNPGLEVSQKQINQITNLMVNQVGHHLAQQLLDSNLTTSNAMGSHLPVKSTPASFNSEFATIYRREFLEIAAKSAVKQSNLIIVATGVCTLVKTKQGWEIMGPCEPVIYAEHPTSVGLANKSEKFPHSQECVTPGSGEDHPTSHRIFFPELNNSSSSGTSSE